VAEARALLHDVFLPFPAEELLEHFVDTGRRSDDPLRHLTAWRARIAAADLKRESDPAFLDRDETLWTAGALLAIHRHPDARDRWRRLLSQVMGETPPIDEPLGWDELLGDRMRLFFEVGLPSPRAYSAWLRQHLEHRHPLASQRAASAASPRGLEGRTHLDAMLLNPATGFAVHFEAKVLSDIDTKTKHDALRNQLARNIDCMAAPAGESATILAERRPERSFVLLLTPELFRRNWTSRLYGHLLRAYTTDPAALARDLPHLDPATCVGLARRLGWLTFEDLQNVEPAACPWIT
jgi:hypothetical protein